MVILCVLLLVPAVLVGTLKPAWQLRVLIVVLLLYAAGAMRVLLQMRRQGRALTAHAIPLGSTWFDNQNAELFQAGFISHLRSVRCRVVWSRVIDPQRVGFSIQKGNRRAILLCMAPAAALREADFSHLKTWAAEGTQGAAGKDVGATAMAVVGAARLQTSIHMPPESGSALILRYEDVADMEAVFAMPAASNNDSKSAVLF